MIFSKPLLCKAPLLGDFLLVGASQFLLAHTTSWHWTGSFRNIGGGMAWVVLVVILLGSASFLFLILHFCVTLLSLFVFRWIWTSDTSHCAMIRHWLIVSKYECVHPNFAMGGVAHSIRRMKSGEGGIEHRGFEVPMLSTLLYIVVFVLQCLLLFTRLRTKFFLRAEGIVILFAMVPTTFYYIATLISNDDFQWRRHMVSITHPRHRDDIHNFLDWHRTWEIGGWTENCDGRRSHACTDMHIGKGINHAADKARDVLCFCFLARNSYSRDDNGRHTRIRVTSTGRVSMWVRIALDANW